MTMRENHQHCVSQNISAFCAVNCSFVAV